jgi:DNA-directed RNA polymerase specialized sigma24 family protein
MPVPTPREGQSTDLVDPTGTPSRQAPSTAEDRLHRRWIAALRKAGFRVSKPDTAKTPRETAEVAAGLQRMIRGLTSRAASGDLEALRHLVELDAHLHAEQLKAAHLLNKRHGYSWAEIGLGVGITKQAAYKRWGDEL